MRQPKTNTEFDIPELPAEAVPAVADFIIAEQELNEYLEHVQHNHPGVLETMRMLTEVRNAALEAADKAVRAKEAPCGPFHLHLIKTTYKAEALYDAVGPERFEQLGGTVTKVSLYEIDGKRLEAAISLGKIPSNVVDAVKTRQVQFKQIPRIRVP